MPTLEQLADVLRSEGFRPEINGEDVLTFKHEGGLFAFQIILEDPMYLRFIYPNFWDADPERIPELKVLAHDISRDFKAAKVLISDANRVYASIEFFLAEAEHLRPVLMRSLQALQANAKAFIDRAPEVSSAPRA